MGVNMHTYYTILNGKIEDVRQAEQPPEGDWQESPNPDIYKYIGDKIIWFDDGMVRIPDNILVDRGVRIDKRGTWYSKKQKENLMLVHDYDQDPGDDYTLAVPLDNEDHQLYDAQQNKWVVDAQKKDQIKSDKQFSELRSKITNLKAQIEDAEKRTLRPLRAISRGRATEQDIETFDKYEEQIDALRPTIAALENDIHSMIQAMVQTIKAIIIDTIPVEQIYLFGSRAYGEPGDQSDIDLYVVMPDDTPLTNASAVQKIKSMITRALKVDIIVKTKSEFLTNCPAIATCPNAMASFRAIRGNEDEWSRYADVADCPSLTTACPEIILAHKVRQDGILIYTSGVAG